MRLKTEQQQAQQGRKAALVIAGTAVLWIIATFIGAKLGLSNRTRALFDLAALGGFVWALWMIYQLWRARQDTHTNGQG
jgi:threonine/homoserine/homoserine lactone efflux protein